MLKKIIGTLFASALLVSGAFAQMSPSGDDCWDPVESRAELEAQGYAFVRALSDEEIEILKTNLLADTPEAILVFTEMELYDSPLDDMVWVALYDPNPDNAGEVCFYNFFFQDQSQIDDLLTPPVV